VNDNEIYLDESSYGVDEGQLHPVWAYLLMTVCVNAALLVGAYALFETGLLRLLGFVVVGVLVWAAALVYRSA
jgi:hypothetical protein